LVRYVSQRSSKSRRLEFQSSIAVSTRSNRYVLGSWFIDRLMGMLWTYLELRVVSASATMKMASGGSRLTRTSHSGQRVAARSLQDALIWLSGLTPKKTAERTRTACQPRSRYRTQQRQFAARSIPASRRQRESRAPSAAASRWPSSPSLAN